MKKGMELDYEMDFSFAKRLETQQLRSPTSTVLSPQSCKRRLEFDNYENARHICKASKDEFSNKKSGSIILKARREIKFDINNTNSNLDKCIKYIPDINRNIPDFNNHIFNVNKIPEEQSIHRLQEENISLRQCNKITEIRLTADRYIPSRCGNNWQTDYFNTPEKINEYKISAKKIKDCDASPGNENLAYDCILRNEILGENIDKVTCFGKDYRMATPENKQLFKFSSPIKNDQNFEAHAFSVSPVGSKSQKLLRSPCKTTRKISNIPFRVLDAPELQNDYYLNLVDWSSQNVLSVGLGSSVYLWSASTSQVTRLCDLSYQDNSITSVSWHEKGNYLALGTNTGTVQIWDVTASKAVSEVTGHSWRVGAAAWNGNVLATGSRDKVIRVTDIRIPYSSENVNRILSGHKQEVCGLKWSPDGQLLASGGNDNRLHVWNNHSCSPFQSYTEHTAAVKAIAWSPHQHGLLSSGGGTADKCIRFWNTLTAQPVHCVDTGSQVCNLAWSKNSSEFVSTHGYSQNQIIVWKYPSLTQVIKLTGHSYRVLYLAMSPDGESIVTGAGDETLRFWNVFSKSSLQKENKSVLNLFSTIR
uniref:Fizzy-related protein homolog n=1 Tax=Clastoptera arizonana TaxID=38151 RepID=A0A1B6C9U6_9HEMI